MASGASRQRATKIVAGVISAAAVEAFAPSLLGDGAMCECGVGHPTDQPLNDLFHHSWNAASFLAM